MSADASYHIIGNQAARERTIDNMLIFLQGLSTAFPNCPRCKMGAAQFKIQVVRKPQEEDDAIRKWVCAMSQPLSANTAKYFHPLRRLLGKSPILYHAVAYGDGEALVADNSIELVSLLDLKTKWQDPEFAKSRGKMLGYIKHITVCAVDYGHTDGLGPLPAVPSTDEIKQEIGRHAQNMSEQSAAQEDDSAKLMNSTLEATLESIINLLASHDSDPEPLPTSQAEDLNNGWEQLMAQEAFTKCVSAQELGALRMMEASEIPGFSRALACHNVMDAEAKGELWHLLADLVNFSKLAGAIPSSMRTRVEEAAARLSADLMVDGQMSFKNCSAERIFEIGRSVMEGTSEEDLLDMAGRMHTLLPTVQEMTKNNDFLKEVDKKTGGIIKQLV